MPNAAPAMPTHARTTAHHAHLDVPSHARPPTHHARVEASTHARPTLSEALEFATARLDKRGATPAAGKFTCPVKRQHMRTTPAYPVWAQIHQNRLASLLMRPLVLRSLDLICVLASATDTKPDGSVHYSRRAVPDALLTGGPCVSESSRACSFPLPHVLSALRSAAHSTKLVLYHNPRGSSPTGTDSCVSLAEAESRRGRGGGGGGAAATLQAPWSDGFSWHEAGTIVRVLNASSAATAHPTITLLVAPPFDMATRAPRRECLLVPTATAACAGAAVGAHGWRHVAHRSLARMGERAGAEAVEVLHVRDRGGQQQQQQQQQQQGGGHCEVTVRRRAMAPGTTFAPGTRIFAPTLLDAGAAAASCRAPAQHAFDYGSKLAADCIQTYLMRDVALGADGSWFDNMVSSRASLHTSTHAHAHAHAHVHAAATWHARVSPRPPLHQPPSCLPLPLCTH